MNEKMAIIEMEMEQVKGDIVLYKIAGNKEMVRKSRKSLSQLSDKFHEAKLEWIRTKK